MKVMIERVRNSIPLLFRAEFMKNLIEHPVMCKHHREALKHVTPVQVCECVVTSVEKNRCVFKFIVHTLR